MPSAIPDIKVKYAIRRIEMKTTIPGIKAGHTIVSDVCREKGDDIALIDVLFMLLTTYSKLTSGPWPKGKGAKFHVVLTVEFDDE